MVGGVCGGHNWQNIKKNDRVGAETLPCVPLPRLLLVFPSCCVGERGNTAALCPLAVMCARCKTDRKERTSEKQGRETAEQSLL